jgi:SAM-dependent methyltransferase/uncharacterized protein YbaR (Trm112 family)
MRYTLLDLVACQHCHAALTSFTALERASIARQGLLPAAARAAEGPGIGPPPEGARSTPLGAALARHARAAVDPARNFTVEVEEGLLICAACSRWYPIIGQLPEILPDHLRDAQRDLAFFGKIAGALPTDVRGALEAFAPNRAGAHDEGAHYKIAEMSIASKIDDKGFFGPGQASPFNLWNPEFTLYLIALFGCVVRLLELKQGETALDAGCGYSWTTEWLHRAGIPAVGLDISRVYLDIAIERMGADRPHLVVGDVEHVPLRDGSVDAVLAYESFHHVPDRRRAIASFDRVLRETGRILLAEPGADHEHAAHSVDVMRKYGILERGMELAEVRAYADGTRLTTEQIHLTRMADADVAGVLTVDLLRTRRITEGHLFRLARAGAASAVTGGPAPKPELWPIVKRKLRSGLRRLGIRES